MSINTLFVTIFCKFFWNFTLFSILNILQDLWLIIRIWRYRPRIYNEKKFLSVEKKTKKIYKNISKQANLYPSEKKNIFQIIDLSEWKGFQLHFQFLCLLCDISIAKRKIKGYIFSTSNKVLSVWTFMQMFWLLRLYSYWLFFNFRLAFSYDLLYFNCASRHKQLVSWNILLPLINIIVL